MNEETVKLLDELGCMSRRWRRDCGRSGGASCFHESMEAKADEIRRKCAKELKEFIIKKYEGMI